MRQRRHDLGNVHQRRRRPVGAPDLGAEVQLRLRLRAMPHLPSANCVNLLDRTRSLQTRAHARKRSRQVRQARPWRVRRRLLGRVWQAGNDCDRTKIVHGTRLPRARRRRPGPSPGGSAPQRAPRTGPAAPPAPRPSAAPAAGRQRSHDKGALSLRACLPARLSHQLQVPHPFSHLPLPPLST